MPEKNGSENTYTFPQKVWIAGGIFALIAVILLLIKATFNVLLLILGGTLIAVFFRGLSALIQRITKWKTSIALTVSILGTLLLFIITFWLIGAKVQSQVSQLIDTLPKTVQHAKEQLNSTGLGQKVMKNLSSPQSQEKLKQVASKFFASTFGILGDIYVILFIGIFFTVSPQQYKKGIVQLIPPKGRPRGSKVLNKLGVNLKKWLKGKLFSMMVVFILTAIGLLLIGVKMWLALALIAGMFNFIPNFGPLIAMIPAVLVALMEGPATAGFVAGLYILVQVAESNFITPKVQEKLVKIPPAVIILAQLFVGTLAGVWGLILATPLVLIIMVVVQELYIKNGS